MLVCLSVWLSVCMYIILIKQFFFFGLKLTNKKIHQLNKNKQTKKHNWYILEYRVLLQIYLFHHDIVKTQKNKTGSC